MPGGGAAVAEGGKAEARARRRRGQRSGGAGAWRGWENLPEKKVGHINTLGSLTRGGGSGQEKVTIAGVRGFGQFCAGIPG